MGDWRNVVRSDQGTPDSTLDLEGLREIDTDPTVVRGGIYTRGFTLHNEIKPKESTPTNLP